MIVNQNRIQIVKSVRKSLIASLILILFSFSPLNVFTQSLSFETYMNPVIPGDHPDPTLTKIGNDFYTSGSSFNPTPKIYHSTDLVHWEVIAQPVKASWNIYGDGPGEGIWGGHMVFYDNSFWHFFARSGRGMFYTKANNPKGPWSEPTQINTPAGVSGLGQDNSIFIDDDGKWYLLAKNGRSGNYILELRTNGQPSGKIYDLTWLNPDSEGNPYGWAEGPVMWKYKDYYYYSFAQHLAGSQYVMRSDTLVEDQSAWTIKGNNIFTGSTGVFNTPNHISPAVMLEDSTSWVIAHSYHSNWYAQGRQGLLCQVTYSDDGFPIIQRPSDDAVIAPKLPSNDIPWAVPHSDFFESETLNPEWSFLGYTSEDSYSLSERPGWLRLSTTGRLGSNTIIKNDGEHDYSLITQVEFEPDDAADEAGLMIINGPETHKAKVFISMNDDTKNVIAFSFGNTIYEVENTIGSIVWLKLIRNEHRVSGFFSADGFNWTQIGESINAFDIDVEQTQFNDFTGNQQGLYVINNSAYFNLYIYRDAYTPILAANPVNKFGTEVLNNRYPPKSLTNIHNDEWALYAGVEFGNADYNKSCDSLRIIASSLLSDGKIEVYVDSINSKTKIAVCEIGNTGSLTDYETFTTELLDTVQGNHDVYFKFVGNSSEELFRIQSFEFITNSIPTSVNSTGKNNLSNEYMLFQNYPNPFNPVTTISYQLKKSGFVNLSLFDALGRKITTLVNENKNSGYHTLQFDASQFVSGVYIYQIKTKEFSAIRKLILLK